MSGLELSLQVLVDLEGLAHLIVHEELIGDGKGHQELGSVGLALELRKLGDDPVEDVLDGALVSVDDVPLELWGVVGGVAEDLKKAADALLGLILAFLLDVDGQVLVVQVTQQTVQQLKQLKTTHQALSKGQHITIDTQSKNVT